jgi:hypothetical protein
LAVSDDDDDAVGYGRPPKATQFKKGKSGNPSGRPKRHKSVAERFEREFAAKIEITEPNGRKRRLAKVEVFVRQIVNKAIKGDPLAMKMALQLLEGVDSQKASVEDPSSAKEQSDFDRSVFDAFEAIAALRRGTDGS